MQKLVYHGAGVPRWLLLLRARGSVADWQRCAGPFCRVEETEQLVDQLPRSLGHLSQQQQSIHDCQTAMQGRQHLQEGARLVLVRRSEAAPEALARADESA